MKRKIATIVAIALIATMQVATTNAMEVLPKDGEWSYKEAPEEPLVTPDPKEVYVEDHHGESGGYVENGELEDTGSLELSWNSKAIATYGCSTAKINYENLNRSNIDITVTVAIFDGDLIEYFGTTFRPEEEVNELALKGYYALQSGISLSDASKLVTLKYFDDMTEEEISKLTKKEIVSILGKKNFAGMTEEELDSLDREGVKNLSEKNKLILAQLGGYNFYTFYMEIGNTGVVEPGYGIYEVDLYTLPGKITLPKGQYKAIYVLKSYDKIKNKFSDFYIHLPINLEVVEDLPEELQKEYDVILATRIDMQ